MADNLTTQSATPATIPASTVIATDDAGASGHVQIVKLAQSTDGSATPITADANGMLVNLGTNNDVTVTGTVTAQDGGGSLTVDGTVAVSSVAGTVAVTDNSGSLTIDNAALSVTGGGLEASALRVTLASDSTGVLSVDDNGGSLTVDGTVAVSGTVAVTDNSGSLTVDNAALSVTGGGVEASALRVTLASDSTGLVSVDDNGGSLTVDGTVTVGSITAGDNAIGRVKITDGTDVALVDASGNLMVNVAAGGAGDGSILDGVSSSIKATVLDYTNSNPLAVRLTDTNGDYVGAGAGTQYTEDAAAAADPVGTMAMAVRADTPAAVTTTDGDNIALRATNKGELYVKQSDAVSVTGTVTANLAAGTNNIGDVDVLSVPAPLSTTGGGTEAAALRVTVANDSTGVLSVDDNGGSLTVDGTVTANLAAGTNNIGDVDILSIAAGDNNIGNVDIVTMPNVTNAGTFAVQDSQVIADNAGFTDGTSKVFTAGYIYDEVAGTALTENDAAAARINVNRAQVGIIEDGATRGRYATVTASNAVKVDASGVAVPVTDNSGSLTVDAPVATPVFVRLSDGASAISTLPVSLASVPSHAVTNAGTFAVQVDGAALTALQLLDNPVIVDDAAFTPATSSVMMAGFEYDDTTPDSVNEGDAGAARMSVNRNIYVQIRDNAGNERGLNIDASGQIAVTLAASQTLATVTTVGTVTTLTGGGVAHDSADSGNPVKVGAKASATLSDDTMVANADRTDLTADLDGALYVRNVPLGDLIFEAVSDTGGTSTAFTNFGATASTRSYVTSITAFRTDSATTMAYIDFRDGTAGSVIYRVPLPPTGGVTINNGGAPLFYTTANTALAYDVSSALTTVYISVTGFKSKARA